MDIQQQQFLTKAAQQAEQAGHVFPVMAACEAALESGYGTSGLAIEANNLFGMKIHHDKFNGDIIVLPTKEFLHGQWISISSAFCKYGTQADCFTDRIDTLRYLQHAFPHYAAALAATNPIDYVTYVSMSWSTDPNRAAKCVLIYQEYQHDSGIEAQATQ